MGLILKKVFAIPPLTFLFPIGGQIPSAKSINDHHISPRRSGRKRKLNHYYSLGGTYVSSLSEGGQRGVEDEESNRMTKGRRKPPTHAPKEDSSQWNDQQNVSLPPRPMFSTSSPIYNKGLSSPGIDLYLSPQYNNDDYILEKTDSRGSYTGLRMISLI
jgi:hypothetical protein